MYVLMNSYYMLGSWVTWSQKHDISGNYQHGSKMPF